MEDIEQCYQTLGLEYGISPEEVENAYRELSKVWHPDRFLKESPSLQQKAREKQREINQAYERLQAYYAEQLPIRNPDEGQGMKVDVPDVKGVDKAATPDENSTAKVSRFISYWVAPILRKAVSPSEPRQEDSETSSRDQGNASARGKGRGRGRRQDRGAGRRQGRGSGRRQRNQGC